MKGMCAQAATSFTYLSVLYMVQTFLILSLQMLCASTVEKTLLTMDLSFLNGAMVTVALSAISKFLPVLSQPLVGSRRRYQNQESSLAIAQRNLV